MNRADPQAATPRLHLVAPPHPGFDPLTLVRALQADPRVRPGTLTLNHQARGGVRVLAQQACRQAHADGGVVLACGGDGTVGSVAQAAWPLGVRMAVLPNGTFNYFGRNLVLDLDPVQAFGDTLDALAQGHVVAHPVGQVNGRVFLVNCSLGLYPRVLAERERDKQRFGRHRWVALLSAARSLWSATEGRPWTVLARDGPAVAYSAAQVRLATLFVGANALQLQQLGLATPAEAPTRLTALLVPPQTRTGLTRMAWRALRARLREEPELTRFEFDELEVHDASDRPRARVKVACDGESHWLNLPLRISYSLRPLWLVRPRRGPGPVGAGRPPETAPSGAWPGPACEGAA